MYAILIVLLIAAGAVLVFKGASRKLRLLSALGFTLWGATILFFSLLRLYGEMLWFGELGFQHRFWTIILSKLLLCLLGGVLGYGAVCLLTGSIPRNKLPARIWSRLAGGFFGAVVGFGSWETVLVFLNRTEAGMTEPILGHDVGFYMFSLPFYGLIQGFLFLLTAIGFFATLTAALLPPTARDLKQAYRPVYLSLSAVLLVFAWGQYLNRYRLMTSGFGVVAGPGWTDVHVRMPGFTILAVVSVICAAMVWIRPLRRGVARAFQGSGGAQDASFPHRQQLATVAVAPALLGAVWVLVSIVAPGLAQWLHVEPNEITAEREYIGHNIRFTRYAFGMDDMKEREFTASAQLTRQTIAANQDLMSEVRLWDWRALAEVYEQFQEIRLYYTFPDVDIDRYTLGGRYRQVMVSPREMDIANLSYDSQTFVNKRFKYTHGYGLTMSTVREFTDEGLPNLLVKDIPPKAAHASLELTRPQIYYGTLTRTPVVVNTREKEFDYPSGDQNVYTHYNGQGGVQLSSGWRKFLFGWMFDGTRFLLSGYPTSESRVLFHRHVLDRARRLAPFLRFETDPYIVVDQGRLFWIIDAYTASSRFPYSEPFESRESIGSAGVPPWRRPPLRQVAHQFHAVNYVRNSVKVVIDAYQGDVSFYVFDNQDPLIQVWQGIFPQLFKPGEEMPAGLRAHVRYPSTLLLTQGLVYRKYHMTDPAVFYNQEDLWVRATEKYYQQVQPVEPYYVMWKQPGSEDPQFVLILPFTPKNKQVLIGWMAAMCDGENYGRLLAYKFPKEKRVLGPQQVETKIDQDRHLSGQLTLWDQRGSKVLRGNVLAIPVEDTLLYVEPIYLQAETAAYPELRLVAVMHGDKLSYAQTFDEAIEGLFVTAKEDDEQPPEGQAQLTDRKLIEQASRAFEAYLELQSKKQFSEAALELRRLEEALSQLNRKQEPSKR